MAETVLTSDTGNDFVGKINRNFSGGGSQSSALSAKSFGAKGDGSTDDTSALENLFAAAFEQKKAIYFESGTYLIRRSLVLRSGMEIYGKNATIKKRTAVTTTLTSSVPKGQAYIDVASASGFSVGDQFFIADSMNGTFPAANYCTYGIVTNIVDNRIYFDNCLGSSYVGCEQAHESGLRVSTSFALLRSWATLNDCDGAYIHDITLDGNKVETEPNEWANSCIHIDSDRGRTYTNSFSGVTYGSVQANLMVRNVTIINSPYDGISDQGRGGAVIDGCAIKDCYANGIHFGTEYSNAKVTNCTFKNLGLAGVFWCEAVSDIIVANNYFLDCRNGVNETGYGSPARNSIITGNDFDGITDVVFDFSVNRSSGDYGGLVVANNIIKNVKNTVASFTTKSNFTFFGNVITNFTTAPTYVIRLTSVSKAVVLGNTCPTNSNYIYKSSVSGLVESGNTWN